MDKTAVYRKCFLIRCLEEMVEVEFEKGGMRGTTHGCMGQEIIPVLLMELIDREHDYITGTHRSHGQVLSYTNDPYGLISEMMGKKDGFNMGMGGSQHIKTGHYITNGVTGGMACVAVGMALSIKKRGQKGIVAAFLGDGGFNEGYVQECLNLSQVMKVPVLFICENNQYAMSTRTADYSAGAMLDRVSALGMAAAVTDYRDLTCLEDSVNKAYDFVKTERSPYFLEISAFRLCGHSKSDPRDYMTDREKQEYEALDPVQRIRKELPAGTAEEIEEETQRYLEHVFAKARMCGEL